MPIHHAWVLNVDSSLVHQGAARVSRDKVAHHKFLIVSTSCYYFMSKGNNRESIKLLSSNLCLHCDCQTISSAGNFIAINFREVDNAFDSGKIDIVISQ
jgi:hypothetical protein